MKSIVPCLWFDTDAEDAAKFYCGIFKDSGITGTSYYGEGAPRPSDMVLVVTFQLNGQDFMALNAGPQFKFSPAVSLMIECEDQAEIDYYWERLKVGGKEVQCGWVEDKFGFSWQVIPTMLGRYLQDEDKAKAQRVMGAMMEMVKIDCALLQKAYDG